MFLNFVGAAIPAVVAKFLTPVRMGLIFKCAVEAVQYVQARLSHAPPEVRKKEALDFALASYDLVDNIFGFHEDVDHYVKTTLLPSIIDGVTLSFNQALWFDTSKPIEIGGPNNPNPTPAISKIPSPVPQVQPDLGRSAA